MISEYMKDKKSTKENVTKVNKQKITPSKTNGNTIFFPAAGYKELDDTMEFGEEAYYWTSTLYTSASFAYSFFPKNMGMSRRRWGLLVRAICK